MSACDRSSASDSSEDSPQPRLSKERRRALRRQYEETRPAAGVYRITNRDNGRVLLGESSNLPAIFNRLRMQLDTGTYAMHPELQRDWTALGESAFCFEIVEQIEPPEDPAEDTAEDRQTLLALWLEKLEPYAPSGYHRRPAD